MKFVAPIRHEWQMNICIDYNGCFGEDPELFEGFVKLSQNRGHRVYLVTRNHNRVKIPERVCQMFDKVIFTEGKQKKLVVERLIGHVQIWIDDHPWRIWEDWDK